VERQILEHPNIAEAIVVGVDDDEFGQRIAAAVVLNEVRKFIYLLQPPNIYSGSGLPVVARASIVSQRQTLFLQTTDNATRRSRIAKDDNSEGSQTADQKGLVRHRSP
jgi:acyl-CoA synthetase (AMP-forming)/AMP-acid ligase II